jgi:aminomethyltransferase
MSAPSDVLAEAPASRPAHTPLQDLHLALGARMTEFAGYDMPVQYPQGIIQEHLHTRRAAGLFDVSHMGQAILEGAAAARDLETLVPGDIAALKPGQMRYTQLLDDNGGIRDDLMATRLDDSAGRQRLFLVVNAAAKAADFVHIAAALPHCALTVLTDFALLALQGPKAAAVLEKLIPGVSKLAFMTSAAFRHDGAAFRISRSGYTGEDGFEISLPAPGAADFAARLLADPDVAPIGLGARDSLRLEAGLCLCGHDIDATTDPVEAGLLWSISNRRRIEGGFPGYRRVAAAIARGPARRRTGFVVEGRAPAREGCDIETPEGRRIGRLTSGGFAPSLGRPVAMGYVEAGAAPAGAPVHLIVRGKAIVARPAPMPFTPHAYFRGP